MGSLNPSKQRENVVRPEIGTSTILLMFSAVLFAQVGAIRSAKANAGGVSYIKAGEGGRTFDSHVGKDEV
jgi:hypothetical protein